MSGRSEDEAPEEGDGVPYRRDVWPVHRVGPGQYVYGEPGSDPGGVLRVFATSREAAARACRELARDELYPGVGRAGGSAFGGKLYRHRKPRKPRRERPDPPKSLPRELPRPALRVRLKATFNCGHPRTEENSYYSGNRPYCRICSNRKSLAYYRAHRDEYLARRRSTWRVDKEGRERSLTSSELEERRTALLMYFQLRQIVIDEGLWQKRASFAPNVKEGS